METIPLTLKRAKRLRRAMTLPEVLVWQSLRPSVFSQAKFRRQHPIGPYILDFFCVSAGLAVELDGYSHDTDGAPEHDQRRDAWLAGLGIRTLRMPITAVMEDLDGVNREIAAALPLSRFATAPPDGEHLRIHILSPGPQEPGGAASASALFFQREEGR